MKGIEEVDFKGKKALVRVDFNVPLASDNEIIDDTRLAKTLPTLKHILNRGGAVILMAHLGRPKGEKKEQYSLKHLVPYLQKHLKLDIRFSEDCIGKEAIEHASQLKDGGVLLLENLRFHKEEKEGEEKFAKELAGLADIYVNDAFGASHRDHASIAIVPRYFRQKYAGLLLENEVKNLDTLSEKNEPRTLILGGSKVGDKIEIIEDLMDRFDNILIGGAMGNTFSLAEGCDMGNSKVELEKEQEAAELLQKIKSNNINLYLPEDFTVTNDINDPVVVENSEGCTVGSGKVAVDIGAQTRQSFADVLETSKTIVWNGPMGLFEKDEFATGTNEVSEKIATATRDGAYSLIGGGDTTMALKDMNVKSNISFISTGGGAMLTYFAGRDMPGLEALN